MENYIKIMELIKQLPVDEEGIWAGKIMISLLLKHNLISYYDNDLLLIWNRHRGD